MEKRFFLLVFTFCLRAVSAQIIIAEQNFEDNSTLSYTAAGGNLYSGSSSINDNPALLPFYYSGSKAYGAEYVTARLIFENISGLELYTAKYITFRLSSWSAGSTVNGADNNDSVTVQVSLNGGTVFSKEIKVAGNLNARWHYSTGTGTAQTSYNGSNSPVLIQPAGGGDRTADGYSTIKLLLPDNSTQAKIVISMKAGIQELWTIDNVTVYGTPKLTPSVSSSTDSVKGFFYIENNGPSEPQVFYISGNNLLGSVLLYPSENYEISADSTAGYSAVQLSVTPPAGDSIPIFVRLKSNLPADDYPGYINIHSKGADTAAVVLLGSVGSQLVINEVLADPGGFDVNGDGSAVSESDRFIEFINRDVNPADVSGWKIFSSNGVQHTFPSSTVVPPGESLVIFGYEPGVLFPGLVQPASAGGLTLLETGDTIRVTRPDNSMVFHLVYDESAADNQSLARDPDITGGFVKHNSIITNPVSYSPGKQNCSNAPLPVELKSFIISVSGSGVLLTWSTSVEVNNFGFDIERSGLYSGFVKLGFVEGSGFSNSDKFYSYADIPPAAGKYRYRIKQIDNNGKYNYAAEKEITFSAPELFSVSQNYPNPFNSATKIEYSLSSNSQVIFTVYSVTGENIYQTKTGLQPPGCYSVIFDAGNCPSGVYLYRLDFIDTKVKRSFIKKMIIEK